MGPLGHTGGRRPGARLDSVASFSDEQGGVARNPWAADWPLEALSTVIFAERFLS